MKRARAIVIVVPLLGLASACASVLGIDAPIDDLDRDASVGDVGARDARAPDVGAARDSAAEASPIDAPEDTQDAGTSADDAGEDAADGAPESTDAGPDVADAGSDAPADAPSDAGDGGCPTISPNPTVGVFVEPTSGMDDSSCGGISTPCKTIQYGLDRAPELPGITHVYVAAGAYTEQLSLQPGITLEGGWEVLDGAWTQACESPEAQVVVTAPAGANVTVNASSLGGAATVSTLTIASKATALPGESLYGVFATGATTTLTLDDVVVQVAAGGDGAVGGGGTTPSQATGNCTPPGDGGPGANVAEGGIGADAGSFSAAGYVAITGGTGGGGATGQNGPAAAAGSCVDCVTCKQGLFCNSADAGTECGGPGGSGCGGAAGGGGGGGAGGGSSVGVFVWDATVTLTSTTKITVGSGGKGGPGGGGGDGGLGAQGSTGSTSTSCGTSCSNSCAAVAGTAAGSNGTLGGTGSGGGPGGGGAGGWSCGYVKGGAATVTVDDAGNIVIHAPGTGGGGNGAAGSAALGCTFP